MSWKLWRKWRVLGDWNYNFSYQGSQTYLYGIEYNDCCWALRFVGGRIYQGENDFDKRFYFQFMLKGLGSLGTGDAGGTLQERISGYTDEFTPG